MATSSVVGKSFDNEWMAVDTEFVSKHIQSVIARRSRRLQVFLAIEALVATVLLPGMNAGDDGTVRNDRSLWLQTNFSKNFDFMETKPTLEHLRAQFRHSINYSTRSRYLSGCGMASLGFNGYGANKH
jgi:hypothetical protein